MSDVIGLARRVPIIGPLDIPDATPAAGLTAEDVAVALGGVESQL